MEDELEWAFKSPGGGGPRHPAAPESGQAIIYLSRRMVRGESLSLYDNGFALGLEALDALVTALVGIMLRSDEVSADSDDGTGSSGDKLLIGGGRENAARSACHHVGRASTTDRSVTERLAAAAGTNDREAEGAALKFAHEIERLVRSMLIDGAAAGHDGAASTTAPPPPQERDVSPHGVPASGAGRPGGLGTGASDDALRDAAPRGTDAAEKYKWIEQYSDEESAHAEAGRRLQAGEDSIVVAKGSAGAKEQTASPPLALQGASHGLAHQSVAAMAGDLAATRVAALWLPSR